MTTVTPDPKVDRLLLHPRPRVFPFRDQKGHPLASGPSDGEVGVVIALLSREVLLHVLPLVDGDWFARLLNFQEGDFLPEQLVLTPSSTLPFGHGVTPAVRRENRPSTTSSQRS